MTTILSGRIECGKIQCFVIVFFGLIICLQSHTKPAPFSDEEDAIRERDACDYCDRIVYEEAISGRGNSPFNYFLWPFRFRLKWTQGARNIVLRSTGRLRMRPGGPRSSGTHWWQKRRCDSFFAPAEWLGKWTQGWAISPLPPKKKIVQITIKNIF